LTPQIEFVCNQARVELQEISIIAVDIGPGLYTGLRVGITSAISIAFGLNVPMIGVSSLDLVAYPIRHCQKLIVAAVDARRDEIFHANYRQVPGDEAQLVGDGAIRYADHFNDLKGVEPAEPGLAFPSASSLVQLAHAKALREDFIKPSELKPLYLRKPDALEIDKQKRRVDR
jgi:tRNA threonylcarbamoyladenosine biosynthesis protein TsaB